MTIKLYYNDTFDDLNVPYSQQLLRDNSAMVTIDNATVGWQGDFLTSIRLSDVEMDGLRYVEIVGDPYNNFYSVVSYQKINKSTYDITLLYDAILTVGLDTITNITGVIRRWSVDDDTPFKWTTTSEPVDQTRPYRYLYDRYTAVDTALTPVPVAICPFNLTVSPSVVKYVNPDGQETDILYPKLDTIEDTTLLYNDIGGGNTYQDGNQYYRFRGGIQNIYNDLVSLGHDVPISGYQLPISPHITPTILANNAITNIIGRTLTHNTGLGLTDSGYNNAKAEELGIFLTLYNEAGGDAVTVKNTELTDTTIEIGAAVGIGGCFMARFSSYLKDGTGYSGLVKSPTFQPFSIASSAGYGSGLNNINNMLQVDSTTHQAQQATTREIANAGLAVAQMGLQATDSVNPLSGGALTAGLAMQAASTAANLALIEGERSRQREMLKVQGTLSANTPPMVKLANGFNMTGNTFDFITRKTTLATDDREILDNFLTAYGYNVSAVILDDPAQLRTRDRFTFIMADDVQFYSDTIPYNNYLRRSISERMSAGLRIWHVNPDYNYKTNNAIRSV